MTQPSDTTPAAVRAQLERMRDRANTFAGDQNMVSKAQYADDVSLLLDALEAAVEALEYARSNFIEIESDAREQKVYTTGRGIGLNAIYARDRVEAALTAIAQALGTEGAGE